jgi:hypothetical protein
MSLTLLYIYPAIQLAKKMLFDLIKKKKIPETPFGTSTVVPVRGMA